jgi:hypothetical protein
MTPEGGAAYVLVSEGDSQHFYRLSFDDGSVEPFGDPSLFAYGIRRSLDTDLVAVSYLDEEGVFYLSLAEGDVVTDPVARPGRDDPGGTYLSGRHYGYGVNDDEWYASSLDGGELVDTNIAEPGEEVFGCMTFTAVNPVDKIAIRHQLPVPGLIFVDLSGPVAQRMAHVLIEEEGSSLSCPIWSKDGTGCLYVEILASGPQRFRIVHWGPDGPTEPETVYEHPFAVPYVIVP